MRGRGHGDESGRAKLTEDSSSERAHRRSFDRQFGGAHRRQFACCKPTTTRVSDAAEQYRAPRTNLALARASRGGPRPHPFRFCGSSIMGAAASRVARALVEGVRDAGRERAARDRAAAFRDASALRRRPGRRTRTSSGTPWPAAETRALALALAALPDALADPATPRSRPLSTCPRRGRRRAVTARARDDYAPAMTTSIDSAARRASPKALRAPPRGAFPWTVAARAAAPRVARRARGRGAVRARPRVRARGGVALRGRGRDDDEDRGARRGAAPPRRRRGRRRSETYERLERSKARTFGRTPEPHLSELSDEDLFVLRPLDAIAAACVGGARRMRATGQIRGPRRCVAPRGAPRRSTCGVALRPADFVGRRL